jgi:hypothetical protein
MEKMGAYCKAYPMDRLRAFSAWTENTQNTRKEKQQIDGAEVDVPRVLTEDDFLYLQEDYTVTDGIFLEQNVIFDNVTPEWMDFCKNVLKFEISDYQQTAPAVAIQANADAAAAAHSNGASAVDEKSSPA